MNESSVRPVRVRLAPSPTGDPHVGNGYVGLFNYVFAKARSGRFILRIEDTDRERSSAKSERQIFHALRWLGLDWDEGPDIGGPYGPYRQSERCHIYRRYASELVAHGAAYPCFCTPERLAGLREEQKRQKLPTLGYDKYCKKAVPTEEAKARIAAGEAHVIRLDVPNVGETTIHDLIRGEVTFPNKDIDDQILMKSDGFPTYHLANVVDDHLMEITHVIRAEEWISSTPKHILLYGAFGWEPPVFAHMPLLRNPDHSKISKRHNPTSLEWYREEGFLPEALLNFLALMGFSDPDGEEVFSVEHMVRNFSWERVGKGAPVFDMKKLEWLNGVYIRAMEPSRFVRVLREWSPREIPAEDARLVKLAPIVQERMKRLSDFQELTDFFFQEEVSPDIQELVPKRRTAVEVRKALETIAERLGELSEWTAQDMEPVGRALADELGWKAGDLFMPIRIAITGRRVSPPLFESMEFLGREKSLARLRKAIALLG